MHDFDRRADCRVRVRTQALVAGLTLFAAASAGFGVEPPNPKDLTQGKWELLVEKSQFCRAAPKKSSRDIIDAGWGLISVHWTGINASGKPMEARYVLRYDGQKYPADITKPANEAITWKLVSPSRVEFEHWSKDDKLTQELVRTVSPDAQTLTQTTRFVGFRDGKDCLETQVFQRK